MPQYLVFSQKVYDVQERVCLPFYQPIRVENSQVVLVSHMMVKLLFISTEIYLSKLAIETLVQGVK